MFVVIKDGSRYSGMSAWNGMMSPEEIWKKATFLEHIGSLPHRSRGELESDSMNFAKHDGAVDPTETE